MERSRRRSPLLTLALALATDLVTPRGTVSYEWASGQTAEQGGRTER